LFIGAVELEEDHRDHRVVVVVAYNAGGLVTTSQIGGFVGNDKYQGNCEKCSTDHRERCNRSRALCTDK